MTTIDTSVSTFAIGADDFLLNGEPFQVLSGALHYFRVHPDLWADRIHKARLMGLNTIETYVAWNAHEPRSGSFEFSGGLDLARFLDLVAAEGMHAIVRPGPYICAEWDNGGLPAWLFEDGSVGVRSNEPAFLAAVERFFAQLAPILAPRQIDRGGSIILVQVENEYGAYGSDKTYLRAIANLTLGMGITVPLTTVDQPVDDMLENGGLPDAHKTGSFGSRVPERLATLRRHQPTGPLMCSEFWDGWFDDWGNSHHVTSVQDSAKDLENLLERGASVNLYMFHGGTNFGFTNGANDKGTYEPIVTSYDYDAPLDEAGNPTPKYWAFREVLARYGSVPDERPASASPAPVFSAPMTQAASIWNIADRLTTWSQHSELPTADSLGQHTGFTLYRTELETSASDVLTFGEVRDRAQVFLNHEPVGVLARENHGRSLVLPALRRGILHVLVEDQGRVDYGPRIGEPKGLIGPVDVNGVTLGRWEAAPVDLSDPHAISALLAELPSTVVDGISGPSFVRATFDLAAPADLFLDTSGLGKGVAWLNGFNLGRYWSRGPQHTLYAPAPLLRATGNELLLFELESSASSSVSFVESLRLADPLPSS